MINKDAVRVGGATALDPTTNLPMFRKYITFEANREQEYINVFYDQWLESNGIKIEVKTGRKYVVVDQPEVSHIELGDALAVPPTIDQTIIDSPAYPMFTGWFEKVIISQWVGAKLGADIIVGYINNTLTGMAFDVPDGHKVKP